MGAEAIEAVRSCLTDPSPRHRLAAAKLVLDLGLRFRNNQDLELAMTEIRQRIGLDA